MHVKAVIVVGWWEIGLAWLRLSILLPAFAAIRCKENLQRLARR